MVITTALPYSLHHLISPLPLARVATGGAFMLLNVIGTTSTSSAQCMSLIVLLSEAGRTLGHLTILLKLSTLKKELVPKDQNKA